MASGELISAARRQVKTIDRAAGAVAPGPYMLKQKKELGVVSFLAALGTMAPLLCLWFGGLGVGVA